MEYIVMWLIIIAMGILCGLISALDLNGEREQADKRKEREWEDRRWR